MTAEIISVGTELLLGNILNTNAQYLSRELADLGITVQRESTIGDNHGRLADFVNEAKSRCDLLVFTGGLGPTADDLTKETVAACFGDELAFDEAEWDKITSYFARTGRETTPNNRKQAMVPTKGHKIINNHGTAPGAWFEQDGHCAVLMPGVPHEMKAMWTESVRPLLMERQNCTLHSVTLRVLGGESDIEYKVRDLLENPNPTAAIYCKTGECEIRITARARSDEDGEKMCRAYAKKFYDMLGDAVYDEDVAGLEETVVHTLQEKGLTIATAESCTGGLIAQRLTSVSGSSEVFGYGFVTYWEQAKAKLVGVDPAVIEKYNVVSAPVAAQMALGAAKASGADIAVSVTGVAGPTGGDEVRPVGTVYLGAARDGVACVKKLFVSRPDRALVRARAKLGGEGDNPDPVRLALSRAQAARRIVGTELAVACAERESDHVLVLCTKKGCWLRTVPATDNPGLWLLDMVRRAAAGLPQAEGTGFLPAGQTKQSDPPGRSQSKDPTPKKKHPLRVLLAVLVILALAAFGVAWYLTDGDLAALPQRLKTLRLPEWVTLWQAHEPKPGARLI